MAAQIAGPTSAATKFKTNVVDPMVSNTSGWYGIPPWWAALLYQVTGTSSYATFAVNNATVPSYAVNYFVGGVDKFIDGELTKEAANTGTNSIPDYVRDNFYNTRDALPMVAFVYDWCYATLTAPQKAKWIAYYNNALTQMLAAVPKVNGIDLPTNYTSYALMNVFSGTNAPGGVTGDVYVGADPGNNYFYGHAMALMLGYTAFGADNASGLTWRSKFRDELWENHIKPYLSSYSGGGGGEGTGYGAANYLLSWMLDIWKKTTGEDLFAVHPTYWQETVKYWNHAIVPTRDYIINWGDHSRDSSAALYDTHRNCIQIPVANDPTTALSKAAVAHLNATTVASDTYSGNYVYDFAYPLTGITGGTISNLGLYSRHDTAGNIFSRTGWTTSDTLFAITYGGWHSGHDHGDKGSFRLYKKSHLVWGQNANTSSGLEGGLSTASLQSSAWHNYVVPIVSGTPKTQVFTQNTTFVDPTMLWIEDLTGHSAYYYHSGDYAAMWGSPVTKWKREYVWMPYGSTDFVLVIFDYCTASTSIDWRWQMSYPYTPTVSSPNISFTATGSVAFAAKIIEPTGTPTITTLDWTAQPNYQSHFSYGGGGRRTSWIQTGTTAAFLTVIDPAGNVTSAVQGTNGAGEHTVNLTFADASTKIVKFYEANTHVSVT